MITVLKVTNKLCNYAQNNRMRVQLFSFMLCLTVFHGIKAGAQGMAVNTTGTAADASAMLDIASTSKGALVPRMTTTQRTGISNPATGLLVFDSTLASFYYNSGTPTSPVWTPLGGSSLPTGATGAILYYNGSSWTGLPAGSNGQVLIMNGGVPVWAPTTTLTIGQSYGGGVIAYLLQPGDIGYDPSVQHGLIAATADQSTSVPYDPTPTFHAAGGTAIGTGKVNTNNILNESGYTSTAALAAHNYTGGGYSDWYLPSLDELGQLYNNRAAIGGFSTGFYFSSSESYASGYHIALGWYFLYGYWTNLYQNYSYSVRAVRAF